jgi:hypothetical protein
LAQFEYVNPVAGLAMIVAGLFMLTLGYSLLAIPPIAAGLILIACYRKYLVRIIGV